MIGLGSDKNMNKRILKSEVKLSTNGFIAQAFDSPLLSSSYEMISQMYTMNIILRTHSLLYLRCFLSCLLMIYIWWIACRIYKITWASASRVRHSFAKKMQIMSRYVHSNLFRVARLACGERVIVVRTSPSKMQAVTKYKFEKFHNATEAFCTPHCTLQNQLSLCRSIFLLTFALL